MSPGCRLLTIEEINLQKLPPGEEPDDLLTGWLFLLEDDKNCHLVNPTIRAFLDAFTTIRSEQETGLKMQVLSNDFEQVDLKKKLLDEEAKSQELGSRTAYLLAELKKLVLIADMNGHVSRLFNTQREVHFVNKGASLLTLRPDAEESFYAKVTIPQASVSRVDTGQEVHLKLKAYNHYQYGILKGRVEHVSRQDTSDNFYVLANITTLNPSIEMKSGYQVQGDVVLRKVRLYRFIVNRLFKKMAN